MTSANIDTCFTNTTLKQHVLDTYGKTATKQHLALVGLNPAASALTSAWPEIHCSILEAQKQTWVIEKVTKHCKSWSLVHRSGYSKAGILGDCLDGLIAAPMPSEHV